MTSPINNLSSSYFEQSLATNGNSSKTSTSNNGLSTFAQLLGTSTGSSADSTPASSSASNSGSSQMLAQMMASFQNSSIQNQGSSVDPMSIS